MSESSNPEFADYLLDNHPGTTLKEDYLPEMGITEHQFAKLLKVTRTQLSELLEAKRNVTPNIALRLGKLFNQTPEMWLNMQNRYDLLKARGQYQKELDNIAPFEWPKAA